MIKLFVQDGEFFYRYKKTTINKYCPIEYYDEEGFYCLSPLNENLFICEGNLRPLDIYDVNICERVATIPFNENFAFDIKNYHGIYFISGSVGIYGYFLNVFLPKKNLKKKKKKVKKVQKI